MAVTTQAAMMKHRTKPSPNISVASQNSVRLYRASLRAIPEIREKYQVDYPKEYVARRFREEWERNRAVKDTPMIDLLVFKGWAELDEAKFLWKQRPHVMAFLDATTRKPDPGQANTEFLKRFLSGQEIEY